MLGGYWNQNQTPTGYQGGSLNYNRGSQIFKNRTWFITMVLRKSEPSQITFQKITNSMLVLSWNHQVFESLQNNWDQRFFSCKNFQMLHILGEMG